MSYRARPDWYALLFQYGIGIAVLWQGYDDLVNGQWRIYAGLAYPWREHLDLGLSLTGYGLTVGLKAILLVLFFARVQTRAVTLGLAAILVLDNLGSGLNHRVLMILQLILIAYLPVPRDAAASGFSTQRVYWNLDLVRFLVSVVYVTTAVHKMNPQFLSGATLWNQIWMVNEQGMRDYPEFLFGLLQSRELCRAMALATVASELLLAVLLNFRRTAGLGIALALGMHTIMAIALPFITHFTFQMFVSLIPFLPNRVQAGRYRLVSGPPWLARIAWPGSVERVVPGVEGEPGSLVRPDGVVLRGAAARIQLLSLSPLTFLPAEILRIWPLRSAAQGAIR